MPTILPHAVPLAVSRPVAAAVARTGLTPNQVTLLGLLVNVIAAILVGAGMFVAGAITMLAGGALDLVDGALARATGRATPFGSVLDAVVDRYTEGAILFGLLIWELRHGRLLEPALLFAAVAGSFLVSYVRARAEVIRMDVKEGLFTRAERVVLLAVALVLAGVPHVLVGALWVLAVVANLTALQRLYYVWTRARDGSTLAAD
jgi:CDP-diacylglycerol---glycerol-3-phosphate 3-phosphatidyltransferase